jgi:DNA-binding transcriptional LysR family regulator
MAFDDVEIRHLRALRAVAEEGSFIGAADILGFSQAAISQQIAGLEKAVGQSLFDRPGGPRPVTMTPAGRLLLKHADAVVDRLARAEQEMTDLASGTAGRLIIGTYQSVSVQLLPELVREMRTAAPNIDIHLIEHADNDSLIDDLIAGAIDVTFLTGPIEDSRVDIMELGFDPFVVILEADGPGAHVSDSGAVRSSHGRPARLRLPECHRCRSAQFGCSAALCLPVERQRRHAGHGACRDGASSDAAPGC